MATSTTNKQPLLVDRVFHNIVDLAGATIGKDDLVSISSTNNVKLLVDCTKNDGAAIGEIYTLGRATAGNTGNITPWVVCLYMNSSNTNLSSSDAQFVGFFGSGGLETSGQTVDGERVVFGGMPYVLFPVPNGTGSSNPAIGAQVQALYVPKGKCLWAGVNAKENSSNEAVDANATTAPVIGAQGGYY